MTIVLSGKKLEYTIDKEFITITTKGPSKQAKVYTVNGVVLSADDGEPLIGATVMVKGTSTGVLTDMDGKFTLPNVSSRSKLEFSYVGMLPQSLSPSPTMKVTLQSDVQTLSEVVVTGMQRMDKRMFTGATESAGYILYRYTGRTSFQTTADICHTIHFYIFCFQLVGRWSYYGGCH